MLINDSNIPNNQTTFGASGLTAGHTFTWYIAAVSDNGNQYFSGPASFLFT